MISPSITESGWEHYPKRLRNYDPLREDGGSYDARLTKDNKRLFTEKGSMSIDILDVNRDEFFEDTGPETFNDSESFETCLTSSSANRESRFYCLKAANPKVLSRSRLHIPQETLRKILTVHQVMPGFVDFLQAFGRKASSTDSGYGGCKRRIEYKTSPGPEKGRNIDCYEICYNIKFVERNNRLENDPWSVRQTCVYQKFEYSKKSGTWILVQPSEKVQNRLCEVFKARTTEDIENATHNPLDIHLVFLSAAAENWRWYYNDLEERLVEMTQNALHATVGTKKDVDLSVPSQGTFDLDFDVEFKDVQNLQKFEEQVQNLLLALETNRDTITTLQKHNAQLQKLSPDLEDHLFTSFDDSLDTYLVELAIHKRNVEALLHRIRGRSRLLYNVLDFRNAETAHRHGQKNVDFAELTRRDSDMMMTMTKRATREAVAVKIVTFVTLFYLPATFVATFLSANCVNFVQETVNGRVVERMTISKDMILFAAITAPLMCITLSIWFIWDRREGNRVKEEIGEKTRASGNFS